MILFINLFVYLFICLFIPATQHTIQMSQRMAQAGADAVMVITPYYFKNAMTNEALEQHFTKVVVISLSHKFI